MKLIRQLMTVDFVRFSIVGALGFVINFLILTMLYKQMNLHLFASQVIAGEIALFSNFYLHHNWTYKRRRVLKTIKTLLIQFHLTSWFAILLTAVLVTIGVNVFNLNYIVALFIAGATALFWNFTWSRYVIWRQTEAEE
jgi:putative flippase GtrA